jgi:thiamine transport system substrate-binding protein
MFTGLLMNRPSLEGVFNMRNLFITFALMLVFVWPAFAQSDTDDNTLTVITYDSFVLDDDVRELFETTTGITLEIIQLSDAGAMVNQSILTRDNPLGDVLYGVDNTFLSRALNADLFIPYEATGLEFIPEALQLDAEEFRVTPVAFGDVCLNYDIAYFEENNLPVPESLLDLTDEAYRGLLVALNPATSSPGLAFLMATIAEFGEEGDYTYLDYWADLTANDVLIVSGWSEAYYGEFTIASDDGLYPLVVSYASSPPAEVLFGELEVEDAPSASVVADGTCYRQIEFAGILHGTQNLEAAQAFIDFLVDAPFQESLPFSNFVFPVSEQAELPELFTEMVVLPENPASLPYEDIDANRDRWIQEWVETVLR